MSKKIQKIVVIIMFIAMIATPLATIIYYFTK